MALNLYGTVLKIKVLIKKATSKMSQIKVISLSYVVRNRFRVYSSKRFIRQPSLVTSFNPNKTSKFEMTNVKSSQIRTEYPLLIW